MFPIAHPDDITAGRITDLSFLPARVLGRLSRVEL